MNPTQAKKTVLVSMLALVAIAVYRGKAGDGQTYKRVWGTGVVGLALSIVADFAPTVAGPFAALVVLGSLTNGGDAAIQNLLGGITKAGATTGTSPAGTAPATTSSGGSK